MGIEVGQTLDKYELLEKVGQGGMAVVYRGRDTELLREVAVKVLHHHLADHLEARDRFEREAQAVAKLRHENILEIFDYSGRESAESYIVTEFIQGQTLKDFITGHEIRYPEIGAMIAVQVCRALTHAHRSGVLHRDVKPENIMIRNDGVVKLTDFGIAQMIDVTRLTVTGQLLGSPAYMSPEHVDGKLLDARTDVYAVGIVLYQLVCGELPFRGRNAHEILKKIADGRYPDPQLTNRLIGNRLGGILKRSLAREMDDRYADASSMIDALEGYLAESGLKDFPAELGRFFDAPVAYELALAPRLCASLAASGRARLKDDRNAALELFNRVLTIDPDNPEVAREIARLSRRARGVKLLALFGSIALVGVGAAWLRARDDGAGRPALTASAGETSTADASLAGMPAPIELDATTSDPTTSSPAPAPTAPAPSAAVADAGVERTARPEVRDPRRPTRGLDAGPVAAGEPHRSVTLVVSPRGSEVSVDGRPWRKLAGTRETIDLGDERAVLRFRNPGCCEDEERVVDAGAAPGEIHVELPFLPGSITPRCSRAGVTVAVDGRSWALGAAAPIPIEATTGTSRVSVRFTDGADFLDEQTVRVRYAQSVDVACGD